MSLTINQVEELVKKNVIDIRTCVQLHDTSLLIHNAISRTSWGTLWYKGFDDEK